VNKSTDRPAVDQAPAVRGSALFLKRRWLAGKKKKKNKYHAKKAIASADYPELAGKVFRSKLERDRACFLVRQMRQGLIRNLECQPLIILTESAIKYHADFSYDEQSAGFHGFHRYFEEVKGKELYPWLTIKQLWPEYGTGILRVVKRKRGGGFKITEELMRGAIVKHK